MDDKYWRQKYFKMMAEYEEVTRQMYSMGYTIEKNSDTGTVQVTHEQHVLFPSDLPEATT